MANRNMKFQNYALPEFGYVRLPAIELTDKEKTDNGASLDCTNKEFLIQITKNGFAKRLKINEGARANPNIYVERIQKELTDFEDFGFLDYILLVWRVCNFCDINGIARGFGRGSVGGSLVCYLINIVQRDPIKDNLFFERFMSKTRSKKKVINGVTYIDGGLAPDVDIDIEQAKRHLVVNYIKETYAGKVSKIVTLNTLSGRLLIKECGKIVREHPEATMTEVANLIPKISGFVADIEDAYKDEPKFKAWCDENKDVYEIALKLRDLCKNSSTHASGYIISYDALEGRFPLQLGPEKELVCGFDMAQVSKLTIKLDILGLRCCSVIADVAKQVGLDIYNVNVDDDPIIYENLQDLKCEHGLFQIEAETGFRVTRKVQPKNLGELADILAIGRPGALAYLDKYIENKNDKSLIEKVHPVWDKILATTYNQPLYQEEMMQICHEVFHFTLEDAENIRRACAKKKPEEVKKWKDKIYEQAKKESLDIDLADKYWKLLDESSKYSFNKCLSPDTSIETKNGNKLMFEIKIGEEILSYDINNQKDTYIKVKEIYNNSRELFEVEFKDGRTVKCSMDHKFFCSDKKMRPLNKILEENWEIMCKD